MHDYPEGVSTAANGSGQPPSESAEQAAPRTRSTVVFPYGDLDDAIEIAAAVHDTFGYGCNTDQLAARLGTDTKHGGFRTKVTTARIFGAIDVGRNTISLTELGARLANPSDDAARVEAFLTVPLYAQLHDAFRGKTLPSDRGLEHEIQRLGVSPKQLNKARTAFQRSAEQAGFFAHGRDRLVLPAIASSATAPSDSLPVERKDRPRESGSRDEALSTDTLHPLLLGLIKTIPREGEPFSPKRQRQWLEAAKVNFALIFGADDDDEPRESPHPPRDYEEARRDFSG